MKKNKTIEVMWMDANSCILTKDALENLKENDSGNELLFINTTYGKIGKIMKDIVILIHEETNNCDDVDVTVIPRKWIISPEELK
jgi:hypothetical protein